jgi:hypothetical protein
MFLFCVKSFAPPARLSPRWRYGRAVALASPAVAGLGLLVKIGRNRTKSGKRKARPQRPAPEARNRREGLNEKRT